MLPRGKDIKQVCRGCSREISISCYSGSWSIAPHLTPAGVRCPRTALLGTDGVIAKKAGPPSQERIQFPISEGYNGHVHYYEQLEDNPEKLTCECGAETSACTYCGNPTLYSGESFCSLVCKEEMEEETANDEAGDENLRESLFGKLVRRPTYPI